jgi:hypothetical protein
MEIGDQMADVDLRADEIVVTFEKWERIFTRRKEVRVPMSALAQVKYVPKPLREVRGTRSGLLVTGWMKVGVWSGKRVVSVRRGIPALRLVPADRSVCAEVVVSTPKAAELAVEIRPGAPREVRG